MKVASGRPNKSGDGIDNADAVVMRPTCTSGYLAPGFNGEGFRLRIQHLFNISSCFVCQDRRRAPQCIPGRASKPFRS